MTEHKDHEGGRDLEEELQGKIKPVVDAAVHKFLGVSIEELSKDITAKLENPLSSIDINPLLSFHDAKRLFRKQFLERLLKQKYGNVSEVAKAAGTDRRTVHRIVSAGKINVDKIRHDLQHPYTLQQEEVTHALEDVFGHYKRILHPEKMESIYKGIPTLSENLIKDVPSKHMDLKTAEEEFERQYFMKVLKQHKTLVQAAKSTGLRYETLHRKIKKLGLQN